MLFHATSEVYPTLVAVDRRSFFPGDVENAIGSNGERGRGCYCVNWDDDMLHNHARLERYRKKDVIEKVVQHTMEVLGAAIEGRG